MSTDRVSDAAVLAAVAATLRDVVIPAFDRTGDPADAFTRSTTVQLAGLAAYAAKRSADPTARRRAELAAALDSLGGNEIIRDMATVGDAVDDPLDRASAALVACVGRDDVAAEEVRSVLRSVLVAQLDDELLSTAPLIDAFRGRLPDA